MSREHLFSALDLPHKFGFSLAVDCQALIETVTPLFYSIMRIAVCYPYEALCTCSFMTILGEEV